MSSISSIKPSFLLDECVLIHWPNILQDLRDYSLSANMVGCGAKDELVLETAIKQNRILVTSDMRLALFTLLENHPVLFLRNNGKKYYVKPSIEKVESIAIIDHTTKFLLNREDEIIIP
jgi:hypothetical protein